MHYIRPQSAAAVRSFYADQCNSSFIYGLRVEELSRIVGCKARRLERFIIHHFLPALTKVLTKDSEEQPGLDPLSLSFGNVNETRRVCDLVEKSVFASDRREKGVCMDRQIGSQDW